MPLPILGITGGASATKSGLARASPSGPQMADRLGAKQSFRHSARGAATGAMQPARIPWLVLAAKTATSTTPAVRRSFKEPAAEIPRRQHRTVAENVVTAATEEG